MSSKTNIESEQNEILEKAKGFWEKNTKNILYATTAIIVIIGGYLGYKYLVQMPKEKKAQEEIYRAEKNFRQDSLNLALNGNNSTPGFLKIIDKYSGTKTSNLAHLYAGECFLQLGDFKNAIKHLDDFNSNGSKQIEAKKFGLLGDAYSELGEKEKAISEYKKAGSTYEEDAYMSSEYLFRAGLLLEMSGKTEDAIDVYKEIKKKFPKTEKGFGVEKYLARLGVTNL
ncbi:MAG: tetratricopeptide repeat protein [Chitinophagaceae bacterium]